MSTNGFIARLRRGLNAHPYRGFVNLALASTGSWALVEPVVSLADVDAYRQPILIGLIGVSIIVALVKSAIPKTVKIELPGIRSPVKLVYGDLFEFNGSIAIPVNEYFDGQVGDRVAKSSIHGQCIVRCFGGDGEKFERVVDASLQKTVSRRSPTRSARNESYEIGTVAVVDYGAHKLFLVALAETDEKSHKANADIVDVIVSIRSLYRAIVERANGEPVAIPLFGGGLSGVKTSPKGLLNLLLISLMRESRDNTLESPVTVVLHDSVFGKLDLSEYNYSTWS